MMNSPPATPVRHPAAQRVARALAAVGLLAVATLVLTLSWPVIGIALQRGPDDELGLITALSGSAVLLWAVLLWASAIVFGFRRAHVVTIATIALAAASAIWASLAVATAPLAGPGKADGPLILLQFFAHTGWTLPAGCAFLLASGIITLTARD
jgi:hypothetical protein